MYKKIIQNSLCIQIKGLKLHDSRRKQKKKSVLELPKIYETKL